jgi:hypothetical protein
MRPPCKMVSTKKGMPDMSNYFSGRITLTVRSVTTIIGLLFVSLGLLLAVRFGAGSVLKFHWWALFIVLPAVLFFGGAVLAARRPVLGRLTMLLLGLGLIVLAVAGIFLLDLSWEQWWPLMLLTSALMLIGVGLPNLTAAPKPVDAAWISLLAWVGGALVLLSFTFLAGNFGRIDLALIAQSRGWWSVFILLCAAGAAFNAAWLYRKGGDFSLAVLGIVLLTNTLLIAGIYEWFQVPQRIEQLPWLFTTSGVWMVVYFLAKNWRKLTVSRG